MRPFAIALIACSSMLAAAHAGQLTVAQTLAIKDRAAAGAFEGRAEWNALSFYLQGVIEGAASYQQTLAEQGKSPLFCPPRNKSYSIEEIIVFMNKSTETNKKRAATLVIMEAYARQYPCND